MTTWAAVRSEDDRRQVARRLARAREALVSGATPASLGVRTVIERSWQRCATVADLQRDRPPRAYTGAEANERFAASPLAIAEPVLRNMLAILDPMDHQLIIVTDSDGTILWTDGAPQALRASDAVGAVPGVAWNEAVSGTNGMGTALAERHPVQIFGAEHLRSGVEGWVCSAAPVRDPETRQTLGVIDLSGEFGTAHPHSLVTVVTAAQTVEQLLAERMRAVHAGLRAEWGRYVGNAGPVALASAAGTIIDTSRPEWLGHRVARADLEHGATQIDGARLELEPVPGGFLLRLPDGSRTARTQPIAAATTPSTLVLNALATDRATATLGDGDTLTLSRRHSEILVLLACHPSGLTDEQIALKVHGENGRPVTARVELSRLRKLLGPHVVTSAPYRLRCPIRADFTEVEDLVRSGDLEQALDSYGGPLLPRSESPVVSELRERVDHALRSALLASRDASLLCRWLDHPAGEDDVQVCRLLATLLDQDDPRRAAVLSRLRRLCQPARPRPPAS